MMKLLGDTSERVFLLTALFSESQRHIQRMAHWRLDWRRIEELAYLLGVSPALFEAISNLDASRFLSDEFYEALKKRHIENRLQNTMLLSDLADASRLLQEGGVEAIALKGSALLLTVYPDTLARHLDDIDLQLDPSDVSRAVELLERNGFKEHVTEAIEVDGSVVRCDDDHRREIELWHPSVLVSPGGIRVELHAANSSGGDAIVSRSELVDSNFGRVRIPTSPQMFVQLCHHVVVRHAGDHSLMLRHLCDMTRLLESDCLEPSTLTDLTTRYGPVFESMQVLDEVRESIRNDQFTKLAWLSHRIARPRRPHLSAHTLLRSAREGPQALFRRLFPTREHLAWRYGVPADRLSTYLYHFYRLSGLSPTDRGR